ncbi:MAG TPA: hypothetical protein VGJ48_26215 [Pyrinomonadaceae bacterium]
MKVDDTIQFSETDFKEVFSLFASSTTHELKQIDDPASEHYFERVDLMKEYELSYEKREFAVDALRAVFAFLHRHGYRLEKDGALLSLDGISKEFIA